MSVTTDEKRQAFLDALARTGVVRTACLASGMSRTAVRNSRRNDPDFEEAFHEALEDAADLMEDEARRRAVDGVLRTKVIGSGPNAQVIDELHYSDSLLMFLLKGARPEKFAERTKSELSGPNGQPLDSGKCDATGAARIAAMLDEARRRRDRSADGTEDNCDDLFA